ncbi:MAG: LysR family transcriptional regulator [Bradyrhizobium sp.]|uniref:LysR family transcriptional regulator n=1 Tax=Bradyrhizobium sp. TaxID=376 RepID=UPI0029B06EC0|nr:LysR family transcriptional regulator [Bradyrhizobium sp.]MDX3970185.1 LysR family transcriptional regulator [Bradyrhizobium sp.]
MERLARPLHSVTLRQMRAFLLTIEKSSASAAARLLGVSQSAVSQQLQEMEKLLQVKLVERVGIRMLPTQAGRALMAPVRRALSAVEQIEPAIAEFRSDGTGTIRLGTGATACIHFLPKPLAQIRAQLPKLQILVVTGNADEILNGIESGSIDVGLITADLARPNPMIHIEEVMVEDLVAIVPQENARQLPDMLRPRDLNGLPLILFDPAGRTRDVIDIWFQRDGVKPVAAMELGSIEAIKTLVGAGLGASLIPRLASESLGSGIVRRPLVEPIQRRLCLALRIDKVLDANLRNLLTQLRSAAELIS